MVRIQIQLTREQLVGLRARAARRGIPVSAVLREAVDSLMRSEPSVSPAERRSRALDVVGRFSSGKADAGRQHDEYLADAYRS